MTPVERIKAIIEGRRPDRPAVSFWHHFPANQVSGDAAVAAHLGHLDTYQLDFLKVMNDNRYPHHEPINTPGDLAAIHELRGDEPEFASQLDLLAKLNRELKGRVWLTTTIFNTWTVLRHVVQPPKEHNPPEMDPASDAPSQRIHEMLKEDESAVKNALLCIGRSLANFARRCLDAGANGIFLSVRDDWVDSTQQAGLYDRLVRPTDLQILDSASAAQLNILHVCGKAIDFTAMAKYPVHVINWADRSGGPSISQVKGWLKPALCGGVDNLTTLPHGTPDDVKREVNDALAQAGDRPMIIAPGCTYDPSRVPPANLQAMSQTARAMRY